MLLSVFTLNFIFVKFLFNDIHNFDKNLGWILNGENDYHVSTSKTFTNIEEKKMFFLLYCHYFLSKKHFSRFIKSTVSYYFLLDIKDSFILTLFFNIPGSFEKKINQICFGFNWLSSFGTIFRYVYLAHQAFDYVFIYYGWLKNMTYREFRKINVLSLYYCGSKLKKLTSLTKLIMLWFEQSYLLFIA